LACSFHGRITPRPGARIGSGSSGPRLRRCGVQRTRAGQQVRGAQEDGGGFAGRAGTGGQIRFAHENARGEWETKLSKFQGKCSDLHG